MHEYMLMEIYYEHDEVIVFIYYFQYLTTKWKEQSKQLTRYKRRPIILVLIETNHLIVSLEDRMALLAI